MDDRPVGVFDSGVGGLTIADAIINALPNESILYFGDTARAPYGAKSPETLLSYGRQIIRFLLEQQAKAIVVACGTISSTVYPTLQSEFGVPMTDVINPGVTACALAAPDGPLGFIATEASVRSGVFVERLLTRLPGVAVHAKACPLFAPLAEEGWTHNPVARMVAEIYLEPLKAHNIRALVLGCTHYPLLTDVIKQVMGQIDLIDFSAATAEALRGLLDTRGLQAGTNAPTHRFFASGDTEKFDALAKTVIHAPYTVTRHAFE